MIYRQLCYLHSYINNVLFFFNSYRIDASLRYTVYCTGIKYGGEKEWDFAFNKYKSSNVASEKSRLMSALACSKETWILSRYVVICNIYIRNTNVLS